MGDSNRYLLILPVHCVLDIMIFGKKKEKEMEPTPKISEIEKKKVKTCDVSGCSGESVKTVSASKAKLAGLSFPSELRKVHLCKEHYKKFKKATKKDRELERMGW